MFIIQHHELHGEAYAASRIGDQPYWRPQVRGEARSARLGRPDDTRQRLAYAVGHLLAELRARYDMLAGGPFALPVTR